MAASPDRSRPVRVLIVDDSALVRSVLERGLSEDPAIEVVATARDPYEARDYLVKLRPDVITLDIEMPRMDGVSFLRRFMRVLPTPTVVLSSLTTRGSELALTALQVGAVEVVTKPAADVAAGLGRMIADLREVVKAAARSGPAKVARQPVVPAAPAPVRAAASPPPAALGRTTDSVIGLGASTGGVAALGRILPELPAWTCGVVVVQHMPAGFTADFARRLDKLCKMRVSEARDGERVLRGHILIAPGGDRHLRVIRVGGEYRVHLAEGDLISGHRPSVDAFFDSLAEHLGVNAAACLLTGMGEDGARGLLRLRRAGGRTFAQDERTSAVWGMPAAAQQLGAAERFLALDAVAATLGALEQEAGVAAAS